MTQLAYTAPARKSHWCAGGTPGFNATANHRRFRAARTACPQPDRAQPERKSHSCAGGTPDVGATSEHRQFLAAGWPVVSEALS